MEPYTVETIHRIKFSDHALDVMARRDFSYAEIAATLMRGSVEPHEGCYRFVLGTIAVVVAPGTHRDTVVTVLLRSGDQWTDLDARRRNT